MKVKRRKLKKPQVWNFKIGRSGFRFKLSLFLLLSFFKVSTAFAEEGFKVPRLSGAVVDQASLFSPRDKKVLETVLRTFRDHGGAQIAVVTLEKLHGLTIEQASIQVVDQWKLGSEKKDDGILLIIAKEERKIRIEVGQGLEGDLPDAYAKRIIDEMISPLFKSGDFNSGVVVGILAIAQKTNPEIDLKGLVERDNNRGKHGRRGRPGGGGFNFLSLIFYGIIFFFLIFTRIGRMVLFFTLLSGGRGGRGGYGGGGGGGFSGGGGGFSGGGASGGW